MESRLYTQLKAYSQGGIYPLHMPGHKRRLCPVPELPYDWDMTEVRGVDDLHDARGILRKAMERTARLHGAARTWYLVNGSTCGLLAGIRALAPARSKIIAARNSHKSVYHAIELGGLSVRWLTPPMLEAGVYGSIPPCEVERALQETPEAACVVVTSPTYEGVISDIEAIGKICRRHGVPLLVDEAHGAHLGLAEDWPVSAVRLGADLVVQSAHKTLPSLTQTALLHMGKGSTIDPDEVERQLGVFETSSPSYPLMVSLDGCTALLAQRGEKLFAQWHSRLSRFDRAVEGLSRLHVLGHGWGTEEGVFAFDPGKLPICTAGTPLTGPMLADILLERYGFETEMSQGDICLAMTGLGDDEDALDRLAEVLLTIDREIEASPCPGVVTLPPPGEEVYTMAEAILRPSREVPLKAALGQVCGEYVWAYPPGVPLAAPGERVTSELLTVMEGLTAAGTELHCSNSKKSGHILVLA